MFFEKISRYYRHKIFPKLNHIRGTTRFKRILDSLAYRTIPKYEGTPNSICDKEEWKNLFIIDACRYDLYKEAFPNENIEKRITLGSSSPDYFRETYTTGDYKDVVYISGNPHIGKSKFKELTGRLPKNVFHDVFHTYKTDWIEKEGRPSTDAIIRDFKTARKLYPNKKIIVHFMKPHHPFDDFNFSGFNQKLDGSYKNSVWSHAERGNIEWDEVWKAYKCNLYDIMKKVRPLAKASEGLTIITSDHGNFCGENGMGHHPSKRNEKPLREVPWIKEG